MSVDEYLHTVYRPDCDYVDGEVLERNMAEQTHSITQGEFCFYFRLRQREWKILRLRGCRRHTSDPENFGLARCGT